MGIMCSAASSAAKTTLPSQSRPNGGRVVESSIPEAENYKNVPKRVPIPQKIPKTKKNIKTNRIERRIQKYRFHVKHNLFFFFRPPQILQVGYNIAD